MYYKFVSVYNPDVPFKRKVINRVILELFIFAIQWKANINVCKTALNQNHLQRALLELNK